MRPSIGYPRNAARTLPFICDIAHGAGRAALDPRHEGSIEPERLATFSDQKLPDLLRVAVVLVERSIACDWACVPIEAHFRSPGWRHKAGA